MLLNIILIFSISLNAQTLIKENFETLDNWEELFFDNIEKHSTYEIKDKVLLAKSDDSASGLKLKKTYDIYKYPVLKFKWKISNLYKKANAKTKEGDDYPIRIYVMFEYNPEKASFFQAIKYDFAKSLYGEYPPHSSLNYIWANKNHEERILTSPYADQAKMILINKGSKNLNKWVEHEVNILEDYKKAFGVNPPANVSIAIMNDSDNTHEKSLSFVDYIEVKND